MEIDDIEQFGVHNPDRRTCMIDEHEARELAARCLAVEAATWPYAVRLHDHPPIRDGGKLYFWYNTVACLDHGDLDAELGGGGPISVNLETGQTCATGTDVLIDLMTRGLIK